MSRAPYPGFGLAFGYTLIYLSLIVLIPLAALVLKASGIGIGGLWSAATQPRVLAALKVSFGIAIAAAIIDAIFGLLVAWVLTRYRFPGRKLLDAAVDLPFALPTAVAGIALAALYAPNGTAWALSWRRSGSRSRTRRWAFSSRSSSSGCPSSCAPSSR